MSIFKKSILKKSGIKYGKCFSPNLHLTSGSEEEDTKGLQGFLISGNI
tara:strand:+ start:302 stop:445 length:144 start_codon:yes stop_codon:yes gene_type:complete